MSDVGDLFKEPDDYYQQEQPASFQTHTLLDGRQLNLRLVGQSPLWVSFILSPAISPR